MHSKPAVTFTDVEAWAVGYLQAALAARAEAYTDDVTVDHVAPEILPARLVTVRDDGGQRFAVTKGASLAVNVWAATEEDASDLVRLTVALLEASAGNGPITGHDSTTGPARVAEESGKPHWFASVDLNHRGVSL